MKTLTINGVEFPLTDKQDKHVALGITGETYVYTPRMKPDKIPSKKVELWTTKGYRFISSLAEFKAAQSEGNIQNYTRKALWQVLLNQPKCIIIYTYKVDKELMDIIRFSLMHGITVALEDIRSGIKTVYNPVLNMYKEDIFKRFRVEEIKDTEDLPEDVQNKILNKLAILDTVRRQKLTQAYQDINEQLEDLNDFYKLDRIESAQEALIWYERYRTQEILETYGARITIYDLDKPEVFNAIATEINIWGPVWDINLRTISQQSSSDSFKDYTFKPAPWSEGPVNPFIGKWKGILAAKRAIQRDALFDIIQAYIQIQYYKEHLTDFYPYESHGFCPRCQTPMSKQALHCRICDWENPMPHPELVSYESRAYMIDQDEE